MKNKEDVINILVNVINVEMTHKQGDDIQKITITLPIKEANTVFDAIKEKQS